MSIEIDTALQIKYARHVDICVNKAQTQIYLDVFNTSLPKSDQAILYDNFSLIPVNSGCLQMITPYI